MTQPNNVVPINAAAKRPTEPYHLDAGFERVVVLYCCSKPRFWGKVSKYLDEDALALAPAKLAVQAVRAIQKDLGRGPDSTVLVVQRLRRMMAEGKVNQQQLEAVAQLLDDAEDSSPPEDAAVLAELAPVLQRRAERAGIEDAMAAFAGRGDPTVALRRMEAAQRIATNDTSIGSVLGPASFDELVRLRNIQRMKTGILELDDALGGGALRGTASMWMGESSAGKSMALIQNACEGALQGFHVAYATLELPEPIILARVTSNRTGVPIDHILADPHGCGAKERMAQLQGLPGFGRVTVKAFTPKVTTVPDLLQWVRDCEDEWGAQVDLLVVDYADKLRATSLRDEESSYRSAGNVYDELYIWARDNSRWCWTASQVQRKKDRGQKLVDMDDAADSMGKVRNFDLVVTLNPRDEYTQMLYYVAKNRLGKRGAKVGPLPVMFECARISPVMLPEGITW